jgi:PAS domain S-box-containing protein
MQQVFRDGMASVEALFQDRHGRGIPYLFSGTRMVLDGEAYLLGVGIDITDRKRAEAELEQHRWPRKPPKPPTWPRAPSWPT